MLLPKSPLSSHCLWNCLNNEAPGEFMLFYPFLPRDWRFPRQAWWAVPTGGYLGVVHAGQQPKRAVLLAVLVRPPCSFLECLYILVSLLVIKKIFFFSCQVKQWLSCKEFPVLPNGRPLQPEIFFFFFFPPCRSCHGSSRLAKGNGQDMFQSEQPAYYFKALPPLRFGPPHQSPLDLELEDLDLRSSHTAY